MQSLDGKRWTEVGKRPTAAIGGIRIFSREQWLPLSKIVKQMPQQAEPVHLVRMLGRPLQVAVRIPSGRRVVDIERAVRLALDVQFGIRDHDRVEHHSFGDQGKHAGIDLQFRDDDQILIRSLRILNRKLGQGQTARE